MKRLASIAILLGVLSLPSISFAQVKFGVGAGIGTDIPILQDDQASGSIFGFKVRYQLIPTIALEPYINFTSYGSPDITDLDADLAGSSITAYGLDLTLGNNAGAIGFLPYFVGGFGFFNDSNDDYGDVYEGQGTRLGLSGGIGFGVGFSPKLALDVRGKANIITQDGGGSRKSVTLTGGLNYYFGTN